MLVAVLRLCARMPLAWLHGAGAALGWLAYWSSPKYAARLRENLYASGVCEDAERRDAMLRAAIAEAGKAATELIPLWFAPDEKVSRLMREAEHWNVMEEAYARGKGVIILTPHLGCFESVGLYLAERLPITSLYRPPKQSWIEPLMVAGRQRWHATLAPANLRGVRMLYKALARGEVVGLLPDQAPGLGEGVWASFFGRPAYTMTLARRLQAQSGAPAIMVFGERLAGGRGYRLHFEELPARIADETALNRAVEAQVRRRPEQYLWSYNRYKIPAGAEPPPAPQERES